MDEPHSKLAKIPVNWSTAGNFRGKGHEAFEIKAVAFLCPRDDQLHSAMLLSALTHETNTVIK
jgi:hypothetical protein